MGSRGRGRSAHRGGRGRGRSADASGGRRDSLSSPLLSLLAAMNFPMPSQWMAMAVGKVLFVVVVVVAVDGVLVVVVAAVAAVGRVQAITPQVVDSLSSRPPLLSALAVMQFPTSLHWMVIDVPSQFRCLV